MKGTVFYSQAELLLRILPLINKEEVFALKGGTAINFFVRDLPRISVDIDLAYLPVNERDIALREIHDTLIRISERIKKRVPRVKVVQKKIKQTNFISGLVVQQEEATVKLEPNLVIRGSVFQPEIMPLSKKAEKLFELSLEVRTLAMADLYAGKICAALDRQHPRDLFDIHMLFKNEGLQMGIRQAFIVYLISHPRPMIELLNPRFTDMKDVFENEFKSMIVENVKWEELLETREHLVSILLRRLSHQEKQFIVSVKAGLPKWDLLGLEGIEDLPAVKWKLLNIGKMNPAKHKEAVHKLKEYLGV